jgi:hypothetical protein
MIAQILMGVGRQNTVEKISASVDTEIRPYVDTNAANGREAFDDPCRMTRPSEFTDRAEATILAPKR